MFSWSSFLRKTAEKDKERKLYAYTTLFDSHDIKDTGKLYKKNMMS